MAQLRLAKGKGRKKFRRGPQGGRADSDSTLQEKLLRFRA